MPYIPEESWEQVQVTVEDLRDAVHVQTQAIGMLSDRLTMTDQILAEVHTAVTKPAGDGDQLSDLLGQLVEADKRHAATLQQVLAAVRT